uniref:NACHT domain-containing protein n=1 Tax=Gasterosteus aculeatus aculeatus TaxID=481459 RepID=G3NQ88_GASAC
VHLPSSIRHTWTPSSWCEHEQLLLHFSSPSSPCYYPECLEKEAEEVLDEEQRRFREAFEKISVHFLRRMKQEELADCLQSSKRISLQMLINETFTNVSRDGQNIFIRELKSNLKKKFQCVFEGIAKAGKPTLLNEIYTELYITEGGTAEVNEEHEVRQIETASRRPARPETTIRQEDLLKASAGGEEPIRTVMTKGVAGIGKTVLTQKFTLDWAEDKDHQDIQFTFPFTFRELNVLGEKKFSLVGLVHHFFSETRVAGICRFEEFQVAFIFDGLDECRLPLDFHNNEILTDVTESSSLDVLLTNLIRGKLLPSARLWITTRPAAANQIPPECVGMVTEVRGFTDTQKEEYFRKRFRDKKQASRIISHIKTSRSLHIMCHIPVFCWITATVLEEMKTREGGKLPKTLTEMYIHFLVVQSKVKKVKYDGGAETDRHWSPESRKMIESLGKLAFDQLQKGNLIFYESDLTECGIDIRAASVYSGVFTQIFREERGLYQDKVFCFVHLSVQEFLAALHVHLTFFSSGVNLLSGEQTTSLESKHFKVNPDPTRLYQRAVDEALLSPNGHLDLFLRFLLGLSLETNQTLLRGLLTQTGIGSQTNEETVQYIQQKISEKVSPEKSINLFHCLNELDDDSLIHTSGLKHAAVFST